MILRRRSVVLSGALDMIMVGSLAVACSEGGDRATRARSTSQAGRPLSPSPTPTPSPTPAPVIPVEYQAALSAVDAALTPRFSTIFLSGTPDDLSGAFRGAATEMISQSSALGRIRPPANAATAHRDLVSVLSRPAYDLQGLADDAHRHKLCTGGAGVPRAASGNSAQTLRLAAAAIAAADPAQSYKVGTFLPVGSPDLARQPANGSPVRAGGAVTAS